MKTEKISTLLRCTYQGLAAMTIIAASCQIAAADFFDPSYFDPANGWIEIADDDGTVAPGVGGQLFDAEYLAYKLDGNILSIGLQAGFNLITGMTPYGGKDYYAGDLALSFDGDTSGANGSGYEYAFDFGLLTKDYNNAKVEADSNGDGIDSLGLYSVTAWNNNVVDPQHLSSIPFAMDEGIEVIASNGETTAGEYDGNSYWRIVSFDIRSLSFLPGDTFTLDAHWTMSCGNDEIDGTQPGIPVPEPGLMLLLGTGLAGLVGYQRRRMNK